MIFLRNILMNNLDLILFDVNNTDSNIFLNFHIFMSTDWCFGIPYMYKL